MPGGEKFPGGPGARAGANDMGLVRNRYLETTEQVRRMPIGMVLIVDQSHVQDVLTAFAKSPLRFQTTQVEWRRYRGSIQPPLEDARPEGPGGEVGPKKPPRPMAVPPPGRHPIRPGGPNQPNQEQAEDDEDLSNLVELGLYVIASLYAKYPPTAPAPADGGAAPGPGVPGPGVPGPAAPGPAAPGPGVPPPATPPVTVPPPAPSKQ
jgi:hypothetical protein